MFKYENCFWRQNINDQSTFKQFDKFNFVTKTNGRSLFMKYSQWKLIDKQKLMCKHQYTIYVHKYKNLSSDDVKHIWCLDTDWKMQKGQLTIIICKIIKTSRDCPMFAFGATSLSDRKDIWLARSVLRVLSSAVTHSKVWDTALLASLLHW